TAIWNQSSGAAPIASPEVLALLGADQIVIAAACPNVDMPVGHHIEVGKAFGIEALLELVRSTCLLLSAGGWIRVVLLGRYDTQGENGREKQSRGVLHSASSVPRDDSRSVYRPRELSHEGREDSRSPSLALLQDRGC